MDFLKSAVASAMAMQGPPFPYSFGDRVDIDSSIWTLNNGTRKEDGSPCSIFSFDIPANRPRAPLARNFLKKLRTLRHPGVIKVLDTVETETYIYIATERVTPLRWNIKRKSLSAETIKWGLFSIATTLKFINEDAASIHGCVRISSLYTSESGEWKLGGFDILSSVKDDDAIIYNYGTLVPDANRYAPPEIASSGWSVLKQNPTGAMDSFNFGTLIYECFNGNYPGPDAAGKTTNIPAPMQAGYKRLCNPNPKSRLTISHYLDQGKRSGSFFDSPLIKLTDGIDNLGMKSADERDEFLDDLDAVADDFPEEFFKMKVLPELLKSVEFGGGGPKALAVVLKIAIKLSEEEFTARVTPAIVRLFANPDRAIRVALLDGMPGMIDKLSQKIVNDKIFPQITTGFSDAAPIIREQTLKSVLTLVTKLSDRTINGELLRHLAKTQNDEQPGIRTNTTICLGKLAKHLNSSTRSKVLIAAFSRSLRDPFVHARNAALMAFAATTDAFSTEDCAARILPALSPLLIDKEKMIRDQAAKTIDVYLAVVKKAASTMPDSVLPVPSSAEHTGTTPRMGTPQPAGDGGWTGWAISSFTNKVAAATGEMGAGAEKKDEPKATPVTKPTPKTNSLVSRPKAQTKTTIVPDIGGDADGWDQDDDADGWGEMDEPETVKTPEVVVPNNDDAGFPEDDDPWATPVASSEKDNYDDGGEPDFAGWLAAQEKAKKKPLAKTLPKGLSKTTTAAKKPIVAKKKAVVAKKIDTKVKDTGDDDGWGDGW